MPHGTRCLIPASALFLFMLTVPALASSDRDQQVTVPKLETMSEQDVSVSELLEWSDYGHGVVESFRDQALQMTEADGSVGVTIVGPAALGPRVVIRYEAMALTPATVLVTILAASDDDSPDISFPEDYDGGITPWLSRPAYFFAKHNAAHLRQPFVARFHHTDETRLLDEAPRQHTQTGVWHSVEVGRWDGLVWLRIDGRLVLQARDPEPLGDSRPALRIRGTGTEHASCLIRDVRTLVPLE